MNQENEWQVSNLELSKKLKTLGVKQDSYFSWVMYSIEAGGNGNYFIIRSEELANDNPYTSPLSAFTVAELAAVLPGRLQIDRYDSGVWGIYQLPHNANEYSRGHTEKADTEADALAKMRIYLLEQKLITL